MDSAISEAPDTYLFFLIFAGTEAMKQEVQVETTWFHRWTNFGLENQEACSKSDNQGRPTSPNQGDSTSVLRWCYGGAAQ